MADLFNDFSIDQIQLNSEFTAQDFANRVGVSGNRQNLIQAIAKYKDNNSALTTLKFPAITPKYYMQMNIHEYNRKNLLELDVTTVKKQIILPMPSQIIDSATVKYINAELGLGIGAIGNAGMDAINNTKNNISNSKSLEDNKNALLKVGETATQITDNGAITAATGFAAGALFNTPYIGGLARDIIGVAGYAPNQFFTLLLVGPEYKRYTFNWILIPQSLAESEAINNIAILMQNLKSTSLVAGGLFWKFPHIFQLGYYPNTKYLHKFKPAVMEALSINYAPNGTPVFYAAADETSNAPEAVIIQASFIEMEYWLDGQYNNTNNPFPNLNGEQFQGGNGIDVQPQ